MADYDKAVEAVNANRTEVRNKQISYIIKAMSQNPQDMPMPSRYRELLNHDSNKTLKNLLVLAAGSRVNVQEYDQAGESLLYCALEMKEPRIDILEILLAHSLYGCSTKDAEQGSSSVGHSQKPKMEYKAI